MNVDIRKGGYTARQQEGERERSDRVDECSELKLSADSTLTKHSGHSLTLLAAVNWHFKNQVMLTGPLHFPGVQWVQGLIQE